MSTGLQIRKGFTHILYRNLLEKIVGMAAMVILARQLSPYDFGLVAITEAGIILISFFGSSGIAEFLLAYRGRDLKRIFRSAFWFNGFLSLGIVAFILLLSPLWSRAHGDPRIVDLAWILAGVFFFSQLQIIPKAWLSRHLQFDRQVKVQTPFIFLVAGGKLAAVFLGWGVFSLVLPLLIFQPVCTFFLYRAAGIRPGFRLYSGRWKEIFRFTRPLVGANLLGRLADQGDRLILGKFLGLEVLGIYHIALQLAEMIPAPVSALSNNILSAVLPRYVKDRERFYAHWRDYGKTLAFFLLPVLAVLFLSARPLVEWIYGSDWTSASLPFQILLIYSGFRAMTNSYGSVLNSFHQNIRSWKLSLYYTPFHLLCVFLGAYWGGVVGLAIGLVLVKLSFQHMGIMQVMAVLKRPWIQWYRDLAPHFLTVLGITALLVPLTRGLEGGILPPWGQVILVSLAFGLLYTLWHRKAYRQDLAAIGRFMDRSFPRAASWYRTWFGL